MSLIDQVDVAMHGVADMVGWSCRSIVLGTGVASANATLLDLSQKPPSKGALYAVTKCWHNGTSSQRAALC